MAKTEITIELERKLLNTILAKNQFGCLEVTIGWFGNERVDCLSYDTNDVFRCYEIKISKQDFFSKCHNTFIGNFNYYVMTEELYNIVKDDIPCNIGVYIPSSQLWKKDELICIKKAAKLELSMDKDILKNSLIRSLHREVTKIVKLNINPNIVNEYHKLKKKNYWLEYDNHNLKDEVDYLREKYGGKNE